MPSWGSFCFSIAAVLGNAGRYASRRPIFARSKHSRLARSPSYRRLGASRRAFAPPYRSPWSRRRAMRSCTSASHDVAEHRTARYAATLLERESAGDGSTELTLALDGGAVRLARSSRCGTAARHALHRSRTARAVRRRAQSRRAERTRHRARARARRTARRGRDPRDRRDRALERARCARARP